MVLIKDANPHKLIFALAKELQSIEELNPPEWAAYIKTGSHREKPPTRKDWWHVRAASILRTIYFRGPIGTGKLRVKYGGRKNRGHKPDKTVNAGGNIIRKCLQCLEKAELITQAQRGNHKGRIITGKGEALLNKISKGV